MPTARSDAARALAPMADEVSSRAAANDGRPDPFGLVSLRAMGKTLRLDPEQADDSRALFDAMRACVYDPFWHAYIASGATVSLGEWIAESFAAGEARVCEMIGPLIAKQEARARRIAAEQIRARRKQRRANLKCYVSRAAVEAAAGREDPTAFAGETIPDFTLNDLESFLDGRVGLTRAMSIVFDWASVAQPFLVLSAPSGIGKTFAASAWLACVGRGFYVSARDLTILSSRAVNYGKLDAPIARLLEADRLVIDEVGVAKDDHEATVLFEVVRHRARRKTILCTNLLGDDFWTLVGPRTESRLRPLTAGGVDTMNGPDLRAEPDAIRREDHDVLADLERFSEPLTFGERLVLERAANGVPDADVEAFELAARKRLRAKGYRA